MDPPILAPWISVAKVLPDIFNCLNFEYSALSGLKVGSGKRKKKEVRKKIQSKKNSIQVGISEHNQKKGGLWCAQKPRNIFHQYR